jgi:hypothetical protein
LNRYSLLFFNKNNNGPCVTATATQGNVIRGLTAGKGGQQ